MSWRQLLADGGIQDTLTESNRKSPSASCRGGTLWRLGPDVSQIAAARTRAATAATSNAVASRCFMIGSRLEESGEPTAYGPSMSAP